MTLLFYTRFSHHINIMKEAVGVLEKAVLPTLSNLVPKTAKYVHSHSSDGGHGAAHVLSAVLSPSKAVPVVGGKLHLGTWQSIVFVELDGPRSDRKVYIQVVGT